MCGQLSFLGKPLFPQNSHLPTSGSASVTLSYTYGRWSQASSVAYLLLLLFCLSFLFSTDQIQQKRVTPSKSMRVHGGFIEKIFEKKIKKGSPLESLGKMIWTSTFWCPELHKRKKPAWPLTTLSMKRVFFWRQISLLQYISHTILEVTSASQLAGFSSSQFELEFRFVTHKIINTFYNSDSHNLVHLQVPGKIMLVLITVLLLRISYPFPLFHL